MNNCFLLIRDDLKKIVNFSDKCVNAGIVEDDIFATIYPNDIYKYLKNGLVSTIVIDSELYNLEIATKIKAYSETHNMQLVLITKNKAKRTIRMLMDRNIKYINPEISALDLRDIFNLAESYNIKKAVHM
ncbi:MAG: hypothetical protein PHV37_03575 [Candidatus Gastranaerophilales bacterium]|nr:hypothetical protein [Candidatus Gastranaerophilales bacterium]